MQKTAAKIAHPDALARVVLFSSMKMTALAMSSAMAKTVTSQMVILGKKRPNMVTSRLSPTEMSTAQRRSSMAFWEFHLSYKLAL